MSRRLQIDQAGGKALEMCSSAKGCLKMLRDCLKGVKMKKAVLLLTGNEKKNDGHELSSSPGSEWGPKVVN